MSFVFSEAQIEGGELPEGYTSVHSLVVRFCFFTYTLDTSCFFSAFVCVVLLVI